MKLVIESAHVREVTMVVAGIELPLTREQVVLALFGPDFGIVPIGSGGGAKAKRAYVRRTHAEESKKVREPNGVLESVVTRVLANIGEGSVQDIRAAIMKEQPQLIESKRHEYLAGGLGRFVESGALRRTGSKGSFLYSLAKGTSKATAKAASADPPSWGTKSVSEVIIEVLSRRSVPVSTAELKVVVEKKYPGILDNRSPSLLATTLSALKNTHKLVKSTEVDGKFAYGLVKGWESVFAKREKTTVATRLAAGKRLAANYAEHLASKEKGKTSKRTKGKTSKRTKGKKAGTQLEMKHLNGAAPASGRSSASAEATS